MKGALLNFHELKDKASSIHTASTSTEPVTMYLYCRGLTAGATDTKIYNYKHLKTMETENEEIINWKMENGSLESNCCYLFLQGGFDILG